MAPASELLLWIIVLAMVMGGTCALLWRLTTYDSVEYDLEFTWDRKYTKEQLEL